MGRQPTVILRHETRDGSHFDWLMGDPTDPSGRLWTGRVDSPPKAWTGRAAWAVELIDSHRRAYLTYQGPLTGGRGRVVRVDSGWMTPLLWADDRLIVDLELAGCQGRVELQRLSGSRWRAWLRR